MHRAQTKWSGDVDTQFVLSILKGNLDRLCEWKVALASMLTWIPLTVAYANQRPPGRAEHHHHHHRSNARSSYNDAS